MSRLRKAATFLLRFVTQLIICWGCPRHQKSAWNALFHEKIGRLLVNHRVRNILEAQLTEISDVVLLYAEMDGSVLKKYQMDLVTNLFVISTQ